MDLRHYAQMLLRWKRDPVAFVRECLRAEPDAWQVKVLGDIATGQRVAMKACKGPGKSCLMAWVVWWFLLTRPDSKVIATSVTEDNLKDGLWSELKLWQNKSKILLEKFAWSAQRITCKERPETWFASARTWAKDADKSQQANSLAGLHADNVLFVLDEVSEYPDGVVAAAEGGLTSGPGCKIVVAGNPTRTSGPLYRICTKDRALWLVTEITGDPDDPMRAPRIDINWARQQIEQWGRESAFVMINVLGKFPPSQSDALIGADLASAAANRVVLPALVTDAVKILGVDCARQGDDRSVLFPRQGLVAFQPTVYRELDLMDLAGRVLHYDEKWQPDAIMIDMCGLGVGVYDRLREQGYDHVIGVDAGAKALRKGYYNRRAETWVACKDWLKHGAIPNDPDLISELTAPTYKFDSTGKLKIESKDDMKARGLNSPDKADALILTFATSVQPCARDHEGKRLRNKTAGTGSDYDPLEAFRKEMA
jgi:phage terminase large subunit